MLQMKNCLCWIHGFIVELTQIEWLSDKSIVRLIDWSIFWRLIKWLNDWLMDWFINVRIFSRIHSSPSGMEWEQRVYGASQGSTTAAGVFSRAGGWAGKLSSYVLPCCQLFFQCCFSGSVGPVYFGAFWIRIHFLLSSSKNSKKNLDSYCFVTSFWLFIFEKRCKCTFKKK